MRAFILSSILLTFAILSSCTTRKWMGQLVHNGQAIQLEQEETGVTHVRAYLNGEFVGQMECIKKDGWKEYVYEKVQTKYGELQVICKSQMGLFDNKDTYNYYIDGVYVGHITYNYGGLTSGSAPVVQN